MPTAKKASRRKKKGAPEPRGLEAAALAAAGPGSDLILTRIASASATCALARLEISP